MVTVIDLEMEPEEDSTKEFNGDDIELFNAEKFKHILHYIIHRVGSLENIGKTVLFKILYFIDFNYYEIFEERLTGELYRRLPHGPAPYHFDMVIEELKNEKKIIEYKKNFKGHKKGYVQKKYFSIIEPDISMIGGRELDFVNKNLSIYSNFNATQISEYSHKDMPYSATKDNEIIDYDLVFYRDELFSVREYEDN